VTVAASPEAVERALDGYIAGDLLLRGSPLDPDEDLFAAGLDSMSLSRLVVFIEDRFGLELPDGSFAIDDIDTLRKLASFVVARIAAARA
jgi:acyl carrier protein